MREGDSMEKSEERNKIISKLQTVIKEQIELIKRNRNTGNHYISGYVCGWWECIGGSR